MSETRIVNRVSQSFGQQLEESRLSQFETDGGSTPPTSEAEIDAVASELANSLPVVQELTESGVELDQEELFRLLAGHPVQVQLEKFKKQVIAAFRHSGLDTRKFFGV